MGFETQPNEKILDGEALTFADLPAAAFANNGLVYLVEGEQGSRWTLNHKKAGLYKSNGVRWVYLGVEIPQATTAEMEDLTSTEIKRMSPANLSTAIDSKALPSISLAERNALTETEDRTVSPNDLRVAIESKVPSEATAAEVTDLTVTDVRIFTPANIGTAIENNALPSMTLAERNALTETADRAISPNDIRVAIFNTRTPTMTTAERTALIETDPRAMSPEDMAVILENDRAPVATVAEVEAMTVQSPRFMSPRDLKRAIDSRLPSISLAERNALTETADRASSPNDLRVIVEARTSTPVTQSQIDTGTSNSRVALKVQQVLEIVANKIFRREVKAQRSDSSFYYIEQGGTYFVSGEWRPRKAIRIDTDEDVVIIGQNRTRILNGEGLSMRIEKAKSVTIKTLSMENTGSTGIWAITPTKIILEHVTLDTGRTCIATNGILEARGCTLRPGGKYSAITMGADSTEDSALTIDDCNISHLRTAGENADSIVIGYKKGRVTVSNSTFFKTVNDFGAPVLFIDHTDLDAITIVNNKINSKNNIIYESRISDTWHMLICKNNEDEGGLPFRATGALDHRVGRYIHKITPIKLAYRQHIRNPNYANWQKLGTIPTSVDSKKGVQFKLPQGYTSTVVATVSVRAAAEEESFRWATLELWEGDQNSQGVITWTRDFIREQGASNSEGKIGRDYASISLDFNAAVQFTGDAIYKVTVSSSDTGIQFRELHVNILSCATYLPEYGSR